MTWEAKLAILIANSSIWSSNLVNVCCILSSASPAFKMLPSKVTILWFRFSSWDDNSLEITLTIVNYPVIWTKIEKENLLTPVFISTLVTRECKALKSFERSSNLCIIFVWNRVWGIQVKCVSYKSFRDLKFPLWNYYNVPSEISNSLENSRHMDIQQFRPL